MAQQQTQFEAWVAALQQTIAAQGHTGNQLAEAARAIADASTRIQATGVGTSGTNGTTFDTGSKVLKGPDVFAPGTLDEEVSSWQDWAFIFQNYIGFMDPNYLSEFSWAETNDRPVREDEYTSGSEKGRRAVKLFSVLSSYLKNRPLKILRSVLNNDGFEVWRRLTVELQPTSRSRSLAMAQALVSFPAMSKGASLYDYVLTYEKLVDEYEKLSGLRYDPNLKIGTLLKGIPNDLQRTLLFDMDDTTTYEQLRARLLEYERSSQTWSAENILTSLSVQNDHAKRKEYQGPIPMEIDRLEWKGKGKGQDGKGKGKGGKGKGKSSGFIVDSPQALGNCAAVDVLASYPKGSKVLKRKLLPWRLVRVCVPFKFPLLDTTALAEKFGSSRIFGGGQGQLEEECHEIPGNEGACRVMGLIHPSDLCAEHAEVIQIGIPREPEDFIKEAVKAGHPRDMLSLRKKGHAQRVAQAVLMSFDDRNAKSSQALERWRRQAEELAAANADLMKQKPAYLQRVLGDKNVLLWKSILQDNAFPDQQLWEDLHGGFRITGWMPDTGIFTRRLKPPTASLKELLVLCLLKLF